jgi:hypothetical protein
MSVSRCRIPKLKKYDVVELHFLDHVSTVNGISLPLFCRVVGEFICDDSQAIYLASWVCENAHDENIDCHTVLKSTIHSVKILRRARSPGRRMLPR